MTELEQLSEQIFNCPRTGIQKKKRYDPFLRKKVIAASRKYGKGNVVKATGLTHSLITTWESRYFSSKEKERGKTRRGAKNKPIVIKELPKLIQKIPSFEENNTNKPILKLTSPDGFSLDINISAEREIISVINTFLGGVK